MSLTGSRPAPLPAIWLAPGAVTDLPALARFGDLHGVPLVVGPIEVGAQRSRTGRPIVHGLGVGGVEHQDVESVSLTSAQDALRWISSRGLSACLSIRGASTGDLAAVVEHARRSVEADVVTAVEVDLRTADDQVVLKSMARVREAAPRGQRLLARLAVQGVDSDLVGRARAAVAGGATAIVVCGQVRLGPGRWWSGPATAALCRAGVRALMQAESEQRWPGAPLVASGGVHSPSSAVAAVRDGAAGVQLGTALWADPGVLWTIRDAVRAELARCTSTYPPLPRRNP
ncbi:MAG: hypothetical protein Q4P07_05025 [Ornithinimicrobium sp.]|uniref:hypothetical protein n=1 Tax=Ornithinimicrobium sp. TaxID=1977084 RepID=UPI0026E05D69|nr:hypothetical protein [Ornithinimicrobium sp.]MDO5739491.1 hypothetical protein [Ornithinimicrobium sp.]